MTSKGFVFSAHPEDFTDEGLVDDFDGTITGYEYMDWRYPKGGNEIACLMLTISVDDPPGDPIDQPYGIGGNPGDWTYSRDGKDILDGPKAALNKNAGMAKLMTQMAQIGVPTDFMKTSNMENLVGASFHFKRVDNTGVTANNAAGSNRAPQILLPESLISLTGGSGRRSRSGSTSARAATPAAGDDITLPMAQVARATVSANEGILARALPSKVATFKEGEFGGADWKDAKFGCKRNVLDRMVESGILEINDDVIAVPELEEDELIALVEAVNS